MQQRTRNRQQRKRGKTERDTRTKTSEARNTINTRER